MYILKLTYDFYITGFLGSRSSKGTTPASAYRTYVACNVGGALAYRKKQQQQQKQYKTTEHTQLKVFTGHSYTR